MLSDARDAEATDHVELECRSSADDVLSVFRSWDCNNNGFILEADLLKVMSRIGILDEDVEGAISLIALADAGYDGRVIYERFVSWMFSRHGSNHQPQLSDLTDAVRGCPQLVLRVHSGPTHAIVDSLKTIVSARDGYPSFLANGLLLSKGHWAFEVEVLSDSAEEKLPCQEHSSDANAAKPSACVGWADKRFCSDSARNMGVGDDKHSWGWYFSENEVLHYKHGAASTLVEGATVKKGDVLTLTIALHVGCARLFVNGKLHSCVEDITPAVGLVPAVSVQKGLRLQIRFGPNLAQFSSSPVRRDLQDRNDNGDHATSLQSHLRTFEDCMPVSEWVHVHAPSALAGQLPSNPPRIERGTSAGMPQSEKLERAISTATSATETTLQCATSSPLPLVYEMLGLSQSAQVHMQQLRLSALLVISDCRLSGDAEMQALMHKLVDATSQRLGLLG